MTDNFEACFQHVLKSEGGFVNHPSDPGGMTNLGVTKATWEEWTGAKVTEEDMRNLTPDSVRELYRVRYWKRVKGDDLPKGVDLCVFDFAVNSGVYRGSVFLQRVLGAKEDGVIGPKTVAAANAEEPGVLIQRYCRARLKFLQGLYTFATFGRGWTNRIVKVETDALAMLWKRDG